LIFKAFSKKVCAVHNPEVGGSSPSSATRKTVDALHRRFFNEINPFGFVKSPSAVKYGYAM
jgi:hypothetical protein